MIKRIAAKVEEKRKKKKKTTYNKPKRWSNCCRFYYCFGGIDILVYGSYHYIL